MTINIAKEFSDAPGGRNVCDGEFSGEEFRKRILEPAFAGSEDEIVVNLDGTFGYPPSFLEEAFGGLARVRKESEKIICRIKFISNEDPALPKKIIKYIKEAND